jgi:galactosyl transferase GMA12/MNN10 family
MPSIELKRRTRNVHDRRMCSVVVFLLLWLFSMSKVANFFLAPRDLEKVLIVTINTGNDSKEYSKALENHKSYADCHGYHFLNAGQTESMKSVHPYMQKAFALQNILYSQEYNTFDAIVWIDRDAIFMDHTISINNRLGQLKAAGIDVGADLFIATEAWAWLNTGVLIFRNTRNSRKIIDDWIKVYKDRERYYNSNDYIHIGGKVKTFKDLFQRNWSCEDQGALIALLAGYDDHKKWNTDRFDGLGVPHVLHEGHAEWAVLSSDLILAPKYKSQVKIVSQTWLNTNPWDFGKYRCTEGIFGVVDPFIFHFNGQNNKPALIKEFGVQAAQCSVYNTVRSYLPSTACMSLVALRDAFWIF